MVVWFFFLTGKCERQRNKANCGKRAVGEFTFDKTWQSRKTAFTVHCKSNESRVFKQIEVKTINWKKWNKIGNRVIKAKKNKLQHFKHN